MTILNPALNVAFANAEAVRIALADRGAEEVVANNLRQAAQDARFTVGSTITARYQYKVAEDGSLIPVQTQITTDAPEEANRDASRRGARRTFREDERRPSFNDLARPRARLSPSDEGSVFAASASGGVKFGAPLSTHYSLSPLRMSALAEAQDENGEAIEAEVITPSYVDAPNPYAPSAQVAVAGLYARNRDIVYRVEPLAQLAA